MSESFIDKMGLTLFLFWLFYLGFAGWVTDRVGEKGVVASSLLLTGIMTVLISCTEG